MGKNSLLRCETDYHLMFGPYFVPRLHPPTLVKRICLVWNSWQSLLMLKRGFRLILHNVFGWKPNFYKQLLATRWVGVGPNLSFCLRGKKFSLTELRSLNQRIFKASSRNSELGASDVAINVKAVTVIAKSKSRCMIPWAGSFWWSRWCPVSQNIFSSFHWKRLECCDGHIMGCNIGIFVQCKEYLRSS